MKKILVYRSKYGNEYWDISNKELEEKAFRELFRELDDFGCYSDIDEYPEEEDLYRKALNGNLIAIKNLLDMRRHYEYEKWSVESVR